MRRLTRDAPAPRLGVLLKADMRPSIDVFCLHDDSYILYIPDINYAMVATDSARVDDDPIFFLVA